MNDKNTQVLLANEFEDLSSYDNQFLTTQIEWIQKSLHTTVPYPYNVNIFSHLYIFANCNNKLNTFS